MVDLDALNAALARVAPRLPRATWLQPLNDGFAKYGLDRDKRVAAAIGQFLVEAGSAFQEVVENLTYTHAEHIQEVFPDEFPTVASAVPYVRNPVALGNRAYANKLGNGDEASGDGYRFRGRGLIQLTGRKEYGEFAAAIGKTADAVSAYCETPAGAALSGCWYLNSRGCLPFADAWDIDEITLRVNGRKMLGKTDRKAFADAMLKALGS